MTERDNAYVATEQRRVKRLPAAVQGMLDDCERLAHAKPSDIQEIAALLQEMILRYYSDVRAQAQQSFWAALCVALAGIAFFVWAIWHQMASPSGDQLTLKLVAGALIQVISGTMFVLYGRATRQFGSFHVCLERTNRFLLANTICEALDPSVRDEVRKQLILEIARAPIVSTAITHEPASRSQDHTLPPTHH
jgi:hypothetical protein